MGAPGLDFSDLGKDRVRTRPPLLLYLQGVSSMDITSPFFVVPALVVVFATCILWATSGKADSHQPTESNVGQHH